MSQLRKLNAILATAAVGSASGAANRLNATQPAISGAIASLEAELGIPLFTRTGRGMTTTTAGATFLDQIEQALSHLDTFEVQLRTKRNYNMPVGGFRRKVSETQLHALLALLENGTYVAAARHLGISQPAVSRSLRDLEVLANVTLWRREGLSGEPTYEGRLLARASGVCLREIELAIEHVHELRGEHRGALRIGALPLSRSEWVPNGLVETLKAFPNARISLVDGPYQEQLNALHHGRIDLIVGALRPGYRDDGIEQTAMFEDALAIVVRPGHPVFQRTGPPPHLDSNWLSQQTWVLPAKGTPGHSRFLSYLETRGLPVPQKVIECGSLVATRALLAASDFAAPLSLKQIKVELEAGLLSAATPDLPGTMRAIGIAQRRGFLPTRLYSAFIAALTARL